MIGFIDSSAECVVLLDDGEQRYQSWDDYPKLVCSVVRNGDAWETTLSFKGTEHRTVTVTLELWNRNGEKQLVSIRS
jgi:hypothetical protein